MSSTTYSLDRLWPVINRWKYLIGGAVVLAAIVSALVSLALPNVFASTAVFLPTTPASTDPDRLLGEADGVTRTALGLETRPEDLDRIITIGTSQPVAELIIKKFGLYEHYKAGQPGDPASDNYVLNEFASNLSIEHNERDAIELRFMDQDRQLAANIANALVGIIDSVNQQLTLDNRRTVHDLYRQRYQAVRDTFEVNRRALRAARQRYGIFDHEMQGRYLAKELLETETALHQAEGGGSGSVAGLRRAMRGLTRADGGSVINLENFVNGVDSVRMLDTRVKDLAGRLAVAQAVYEAADVSIRGRVSSLYVVQKAYPATRKSKPVRWLIVVSSVLVTFGLTVVVAALLELNRYRRRQPALAR